ncbi:MAG TPA: endopeptidase La [Elusimicrobiales bacterium]|nr:endopeptidase La [Elusimicrobiales bacterium]
MSENIKKEYPFSVPLIAIRDLVVFPNIHFPLAVSRIKSVNAVEISIKDYSKYIVAVTQKKPNIEDPKEDDLYKVGVLCEINQHLKLPDGTMRVILSGIKRVKITSIKTSDNPESFIADVEYPEEIAENNSEMLALTRHLVGVFDDYVKLTTKMSLNASVLLEQVEEPSKLSDNIASNIIISISEKQDILETFDLKQRIEKLIKYIKREIEIISIEQKIQTRVKSQIEKSQKEYYLNEQMKAIQKELHQKDDFQKEIEEWRKKIKSSKMPKEAEDAAEKELNRLAKMMPFSPESTVSRTYLDWLTSLPWSVETKDVLDLKKAKEILDKEHFGLKKPKERVLEFLAVAKLTEKLKGPILCFVGPPGVGKTSIARSIANSMGRNFVRMSLGGVRDEAEIRGHRRTYIGSMPGRIIQSLKKAKSKNPVFLMDEIDKMGMDWRGDPAAALLEVLDPEQNKEFVDHYIDIPFDISKVMFIATANTLEGIPVSLRDRLEIIEFSGYTHNEKLQIAKQYLVPRQFSVHGIDEKKSKNIKISDSAILRIVREYTKEAGVRNLEREIASLTRKIAVKIVEGEKNIEINEKNLTQWLDVPKYIDSKIDDNSIGVATGLAWTEHGGEVLWIEAIDMPGKGQISVTGRLGDVMKESVQIAFSYVKNSLNADSKYISSRDFHVHVPEGAVPKDGPSAGITIATALYSLLSKKPVKKGVSMTGEITLTGKVLPIGGLKEKIIASHREKIMTVLYPLGNKKDLSEIPDEIKKDMNLIPISSAEEAFSHVIEGYKKKKGKEKIKL